ncbi:hypothetical protein SELMODRAFT_432091 [Selaginella moellendorffii]|uniref:Uncharacterized protein n=1 Tax=Selaginella moellendorffii TaxID=88036 RepID=D8TEY6_SELML|nr:hypothetical protein SELMODRAFT_432093 [Selaginella moellendorffii]EFJ04784.1 hypothetical protein SELMODRAFT_432091 [Selaginella moellendorffii]
MASLPSNTKSIPSPALPVHFPRDANSSHESFATHLWRSVTVARVFPAATDAIASEDLIRKPLSYAAGIVKASLKKTNNKQHMISAVDYVFKNLKPNTAGGSRTGYDPNVLITGWSGLPWNDVDFGFGHPSFAGPIGSHMEGVIRVIPRSKAGDMGVRKIRW